jgi:hypothetical protein
MWEHRPLGIVLLPALKKKLNDGEAPGSALNLSGSCLKEGAVVAVGEKPPQKKNLRNLKEGETTWAETSTKKERWHTDRLLGTNSLKDGAMWHDAWTPEMCSQRNTAETPIDRQRFIKHVPDVTLSTTEGSPLLGNGWLGTFPRQRIGL